MTVPVLSVRNLEVEFLTRRSTLRAINGVSFDIAKGEVLGVVGESGAGKSVTGLAVIGLIDPPGRIAGGEIYLSGMRIDHLPPEEIRRIRGKRIGMIFQDPLTSLNPLYRIGEQIVETIRTHLNLSETAARKRAIDLLAEVGIPAPEKRIDAYPHEFSGGMRQRVVIALAICAEPELIIADEPTTALDVSVQAQIISLIKRLGRDHGTAVMLVTHDMGVIAETADRVAVMYSGRIAEIGPVQDVVQNPLHPYAKGLMGAIPTLAGEDKRLVQIPGSMPRLSAIPPGCAFNPRCAFAFDRCRVERPEPIQHGSHAVACHLFDTANGDRGMTASFVDVRDLRRVFDVSKPWLNRVLEGGHLEFLKAVDGVTFDIRKGETFALVGESGSGKSTVARMVVGLLPPSSGEVIIDGVSMTDSRQSQTRQRLRRRIQMVFQDPYASLNPRLRVDAIVSEPIRAFDLIQGERHIAARVGELLSLVGLHPDDGLKFPARVLRRPAPAHRNRPRAGVRGRIHRLRRADLGARRLGAGADPQPDARPAGQVRPDLPVHQPQPRRGPPHGDPHRRDVSRPHRRDRRGPRIVRQSPACPTPDAARRGARSRHVRAPARFRSRAKSRTRSIRRPAARSTRAARWRSIAAASRRRR